LSEEVEQIGDWKVPVNVLRSQHGQDRYVLEHTARHRPLLGGGSVTGGMYYVDVGAYDGFKLSNTWALYCLDWNGICIEPSRQFPLLQGKRHRDCCINTAAWTHRGEVRIVENGMLTKTEAISDMVNPDQTNIQTVKCDALFNLLRIGMRPNDAVPRAMPWLQYLSVDIEGNELPVMTKFFEDNKAAPEHARYNFNIIGLEWRDHNKSDLIALMKQNGYLHHATLGTDLMFQHVTYLLGDK
jgi:hypothetical protein